MRIVRSIMMAAAVAVLGGVPAAGQDARGQGASAPVDIFHGSQSGQETRDALDGGGNPFAGALIEALRQPRLSLADLSGLIEKLTSAKSEGLQQADVPRSIATPGWQVVPPAAGEARVALVVVVADYSVAQANSLPGAARDADRVATALRQAGFATTKLVDADRTAIRLALLKFAADSAAAGSAVIYTTGHGVEYDGRVHLLMGDYPLQEGSDGLADHALRLSEIAEAARARTANLVFYGGCRNNPFAR